VTQTHTTFGDRAFAAAGPALWMEQFSIASDTDGIIVQQILAIANDILFG